MNELRNEPKLSMTGAAAQVSSPSCVEASVCSLFQDFFLSYKPFHAVKAGLANDIVVKTVQKKLTPLLGTLFLSDSTDPTPNADVCRPRNRTCQ